MAGYSQHLADHIQTTATTDDGWTSQLLKGHPPEENYFYRNHKLHDVRYGNLFDGDVTYSFIGFDGPISVINYLISVCTIHDGQFARFYCKLS